MTGMGDENGNEERWINENTITKLYKLFCTIFNLCGTLNFEKYE
jgi:hypothetical protein